MITDDVKCTREIKAGIVMAKRTLNRRKTLFARKVDLNLRNFTNRVDLNLRKKLVKWYIILYATKRKKANRTGHIVRRPVF
jgi:hypothetical protein